MIGTIKPQYNDIHFSGHESFPCRTLWLKKGYDFIKSNGNFNADDAVVTLGVGKNMVSAIRYWYKVFGFNSESLVGLPITFSTTTMAKTNISKTLQLCGCCTF